MSENNKKDSKELNQNDMNIQVEKDIDKDALNVIFRLYDETFKDLVER